VSDQRILRHHLADRLYHWTMAVALLTCLFTAFLPILGWKFEWVTTHWIAGIVLTAVILLHIVRAVLWQDFWSMVLGPRDLRSSWRFVARGVRLGGPPPQRDAKYSPLQKSFHMLVAIAVLAIVATGLMMLSKIDTPFWRRNPYWLADSEWGMVYAIHGLFAMATISLIMAHLYFAVRPEKLWMTRSMFHGWISREDYLRHHDPQRWPVPDVAPTRRDDHGTAYPAGE
jgi:thiosulfate reductase cytochrome b subunit